MVRTAGEILLTDQRFVFLPLTLKPFGGKAALVFAAGNSVAMLDDHYLSLLDISGVTALEGPSRLVVHLTSGADRGYVVFSSRFSTSFSKKNAPYKDNVVERIREAVRIAHRRRGNTNPQD